MIKYLNYLLNFKTDNKLLNFTVNTDTDFTPLNLKSKLNKNKIYKYIFIKT